VAETTENQQVRLTEAAASKARALLAASERPGDALRVRVVNGGCSGMRYELVFDGDVASDDTELDQHGLRVLVDTESASFLAGVIIDYSDQLNDAGFKIENPSASTTCGCGESFAL